MADSPSVLNDTSSTESPASGQTVTGPFKPPRSSTVSSSRQRDSVAESPSPPKSGRIFTPLRSQSGAAAAAAIPLAPLTDEQLSGQSVARSRKRRSSVSQFTAGQREEVVAGASASLSSQGPVALSQVPDMSQEKVAAYLDVLSYDVSHNPVLNAKRWALEDKLRRATEDLDAPGDYATLQVYLEHFPAE